MTDLRLPAPFLSRMEGLLGDEFPAFREALERGAPRPGLRVNPLKVDPASFPATFPHPLEPVPWCPEGFLLPEGVRVGRHPYHAAGLFYLQEPSAMAVGTLTDPRPGERILDLAASPGGKATHLLGRTAGEGLVVVNEIRRDRIPPLAQNLARWGARNLLLLQESPERLAQRWPEGFDRVVVDAPCSGEGMFRREPRGIRYWGEGMIRGCARLQGRILAAAARLVRPGGLLVYATCTFAPEEDEVQVARFLEAHPDFELAEPPPLPGLDRGRPEWAGERARPELARCVRLWPHRGPGEGHFVALLRRQGEGPARLPAARSRPLPRRLAALWEAFAADLLVDPWPEGGSWVVQGAHLYWRPPGAPEPAGLKMAWPGFPVGTFRKDRFEPAHALACSLRAGQVTRVLDLPQDDPRVQAYLRGEPLPVPGYKGWVLVAVDGFGLGWGKGDGRQVKNRLPKGMRWGR